MNRFRNFLPLVAVLAVGVVLAAPGSAKASFQIRFTEVDSSNKVIATATSAVQSNTGGITFQAFNTSLADFTVTAANNIATTGGFITSHSETINITYNGSTIGAGGPKLLVEFIGDNYLAPPTSLAFITSNASPSSAGLSINSITMASSVINGNTIGGGLVAPVIGSTYTGAITAGLLGTTNLSGSSGVNTSAVLTPNPGVGPNFGLSTPFTFYQSYSFSNFGQTGVAAQAFSAGSSVSAVPAPAGLVLALTGLPALGAIGWLRRRKAKLAV